MPQVFVRLARPAERLRWPDNPNRYLNPGGEIVEASDAYWACAIADGSVVVAEPPALQPEPPQPEPAKEP